MYSAGSTADPCAAFPNKATPPGSSAYYSVRFERPALRQTIALLFAWRGTLWDLLTECTDQGVARLKLQWWREEIVRSRDGQASHPLARQLIPVLRSLGLPLEPFTEMADAVESEIRRLEPVDLPALMRHTEQDQGALFELIGRCHGLEERERLEALRRLGGACGLVYLIRDLGAHRRRDYHPLPSAPPRAQGEDQSAALARLASHARELAGESGGRELPPSVAARSAILMSLLDELERSGFPVMEQRVCLTPLRKLWIAWRASRRGLVAER
jgi:phytoene synthase